MQQAVEAHHVVGVAAGGSRARPHEQRAQLVALEEFIGELAHRHELIDRLDSRLRPAEQRFERVGRAPGRRNGEAVLGESRLPVLRVFVEQIEVSIRVGLRKALDLTIGLVDVVGRVFLPARRRIGYPIGGIADVARAVVEDDAFVALGEDVAHALGAEIEIPVGGMAVEARPVGADVHAEARGGAVAAAQAAAQLAATLEHRRPQTGRAEIGGDDRAVMAAADDDGVIMTVRHGSSRVVPTRLDRVKAACVGLII